MDEPDAVIDARGLRCPLPVIRLAAYAREALTSQVVEVLATDPAARADIPAWCRLRRQEYLGAADRRGGEPGEAGEPGEPGQSGVPGGHTAYRVRLTPAAGQVGTSGEPAAAPPGGGVGTPDG